MSEFSTPSAANTDWSGCARARRARSLLLLCAGLWIAACERAASPPRVLHHRLTRPSNPDGVFLNEDLVFYFSDDLDRTSVTRDSVRIASADGRRARGRLSVDGKSLRFAPDPVLAADLSDGGYTPDTQYTVEILGFPNPHGVRGARGEPLESTYRWSFRTVRVTLPRTALVFDDRMQDKRPRLWLRPSPLGRQESGVLIGPRDSIFLASDKPLDPASVRDEDFELRPKGRSGASVGLRARLVENESEALPRSRQSSEPERRALIELTPKQGLALGEYSLVLLASRDGLVFNPRDFSDHAVLAVGSSFSVRVAEEFLDAGRGVLHEAFLDTRLRSPVAVPGYDGTAHWSDSGRVEVRYPAAAGDGSHGVVELAADEPRVDVQATRLHLPAGVSSALSSSAGLVVLRCQGRLSIEGQLVRAAPPTAKLGFEGADTLSQWLGAAREANSTWTVLIAGGDLVIDGTLRVSTPLLLCAGGVIRVSGTVSAAPAQLYLLGEGGGLSIDPSERAKAPLVIDPPLRNPLKVPLRLAVLSGPIPPHGEVLRWLEEEVRGSATARGARGASWSVRYVQELTGAAIDDERLVPLESPRLFEQPGSLQLLITLEVEPGPVWDPPFVDYVRLSWEQPSAEKGVR